MTAKGAWPTSQPGCNSSSSMKRSRLAPKSSGRADNGPRVMITCPWPSEPSHSSAGLHLKCVHGKALPQMLCRPASSKANIWNNWIASWHAVCKARAPCTCHICSCACPGHMYLPIMEATKASQASQGKAQLNHRSNSHRSVNRKQGPADQTHSPQCLLQCPCVQTAAVPLGLAA